MSTTTAMIDIVIPATRTPPISDLLPGSVIFRWATQLPFVMASELPCHSDQMGTITFDPRAPLIRIDQPVVCRRCFTIYIATPVPADDKPEIRYRHAGRVAMSRPKRYGD